MGGGGTDFLRPVTVLTYVADHALWGIDPAGWHLTNLLLHMGVCLLLIPVAKGIFELAGLERAGPAALFTAVLFAVVPSHSESVLWISGRTDLLASLFALAATLAFMRGLILPAVLIYAVGMLSKESVLTVPFMWLLLPARTTERKTRLIAVVLPVLYLGARILIDHEYLATIGSGVGQTPLTPADLAGNILRIALRLLLPPLPGSLEPFLARVPPVAFAPLAAAAAAVVMLLSRGLSRSGVHRAPGALLVCLLLALVPVARFRVALFDTQSERMLYLPGILAVMIVTHLSFTIVRRRAITDAFLTVLVASGVLASIPAVQQWTRAARLCSSIATSLAAHPPGDAVLVNVPDNLNGAFVFRNGLDEAVSILGDRSMRGVGYTVLCTHSISSIDDEVSVTTDSASVCITIPTGERFCMVDSTLIIDRPDPHTLRFRIPAGDGEILAWSGERGISSRSCRRGAGRGY